MVGRIDPSNSDNQNGDGGGLVCACACVCTYVCMRACMHDVFAIYDNNTLPRLIMIIIKIIFLYFIEIAVIIKHHCNIVTRLLQITKHITAL